MSDFKQAIIDQLVVAGIYKSEHEIDARLALNDLIAFHSTIALDSRVSKPAAELHNSVVMKCVNIAHEKHTILAIPAMEKLLLTDEPCELPEF